LLFSFNFQIKPIFVVLLTFIHDKESDEPDYNEDEEYNTIVVNLLCWWDYFSN
jgi:hypothetical protein